MHDFDDDPTSVDQTMKLIGSPVPLKQAPEEPGTPPAYVEIVINDPGVLCRGERLLSLMF